MRIAILGATSSIARDLIRLIILNASHQLYLFSRNQAGVSQWLSSIPPHDTNRIDNQEYSQFLSGQDYDLVINFVGIGDPVRAANIGSSIFGVTHKYDELCLAYLQINPACRYIFISSGAAYGSIFDKPATAISRSTFPINEISKQDWYGVAKMYTEVCHRSTNFPIVDIRIFNYFSSTLSIDANFFISELIRAIKKKTLFLTSKEDIIRDYVGSVDFFHLINAILSAPPTNTVVDCYSAKPINKYLILKSFEEEFGLKYEFTVEPVGINATGNKSCYYSTNYSAKNLGYIPSKNSLDLLISESRKVLSSTLTP
jgi:nucleoside-diphosphate-sugar epimerase